MAVSRVDLLQGGQVVTAIDLTDSTVTPASLMQGVVAYGADGSRLVGTATGGDEGSAYQDEDGYIVLGEGESSAPQGNISITANGTYDVTQYAGASVEVPVGLSKTDLRNLIEGSSNFTDIEWPDGVTKIKAGMFQGCTGFNPSGLPSGVTSIGAYAFYACSSLTITSLPNQVAFIDGYAFYNCHKLALTSLPDGITSIGTNAFRSCSNLALTSLPDGLIFISDYTFYGCTNLQLTSLPSGLTGIGPYAFYACPKLALTSIPDSVTSIGQSAFLACRSLAITKLPSGLKTIGSSAFTRCSSLTSLSCEGAITTLNPNTFNGDSNFPMSLTSVSFPNMALASTIGAVFGSTTAANACQLLEFCDIGSTTGIAANAFANCHALETLVLRKTASVCTLSNVSAFTNTPMRGYNNLTGKVYVPSALISSYQTATNWSTLYNAGTVEFVAIEGSEYER